MIIIVGADAREAASHVSSWLGRHGRAHEYSQSIDAAVADRAATAIRLVTTDLAGLAAGREAVEQMARVRRTIVLYRISTLMDIHSFPLWLRDHDYLHLIVLLDRELVSDWHWLTATVMVAGDAAGWAKVLDPVRAIILPRTIMTASLCSTAVH